MNKLILTLIYFVLFTSCQQNNPTPTTSFTGFTERNVIGEAIGNIDSSDWTLDNSWSQVEKIFLVIIII